MAVIVNFLLWKFFNLSMPEITLLKKILIIGLGLLGVLILIVVLELLSDFFFPINEDIKSYLVMSVICLVLLFFVSTVFYYGFVGGNTLISSENGNRAYFVYKIIKGGLCVCTSFGLTSYLFLEI